MKKCFLVFAAIVLLQSTVFAQQQPSEKPAAQSSPVTDSAALREEIDSLIRNLSSDEWETRENATKRLIEIGAPAVPAVAALRTASDIEVRVRAVRILDALYWVSTEDVAKIEELISKYVGEPSSELAARIEELAKKLSNEDFKTREEATRELIEIGKPALTAIDKLKEADDAEVKTRAERAANEIRGKSQEMEAEVVKQIKEIKHSDFYLLERLCPATTANKHKETEIGQILASLLNLSSASEDDGEGVVVRKDARGGVVVITKLKVLGQKGQGRVIIDGKEIKEGGSLKKDAQPAEVLVAIVRDSEQNTDLRTRAARALAARSDKCAVTSLIITLSELKGKIQLAAGESLRKLTGENFGPFENSTPEETDKCIKEWKEWLEKNKEIETYRFKDQQSSAPDESDELGAIFRRLRKEGNLPKEAEELLKKQRDEKEKQKEKENPPEKPEKEREF